MNGDLLRGLQAFHQPLKDSFSREQNRLRRKQKRKRGVAQADESGTDKSDEDVLMKISIKCRDSRWSVPATIPPTGSSHGVIRVVSSRWPALTQNNSEFEQDTGEIHRKDKQLEVTENDTFPRHTYRKPCLDPSLMELCYSIDDLEGDWGEFSRLMTTSPRFLLKNDSKTVSLEVKQTGASDGTFVSLLPGDVKPFYWADFRLPGLVSVRPVSSNVFRWSGGFDICSLGMTAIRVRQKTGNPQSQLKMLNVRSIRAQVEIRPGTGGFGINASFREEDANGVGSLFRIENWSAFPVWIAQDGVLANPRAAAGDQILQAVHGKASCTDNINQRNIEDNAEIDGDLVRPLGKISFALDVPYRQGKYAHRKAATLSELLRVRVALAPLGSRPGIESVKVIGLTTVGDSIRLNPSKLLTVLAPEIRTRLQRVRVLCIVTTDGPTRVLKFW